MVIEEHLVTARKGGSHSGQEPQFCSSFFEDRKSVPLLLGSHPSPAGPIASATGQGGCLVPQPQDRGLSPQLAPSLLSSPVLASLLPAPCHCRLPPELSPLDTPAPGHHRLHFPASLAHKWSLSLQVPACPCQTWGAPPPPLTL